MLVLFVLQNIKYAIFKYLIISHGDHERTQRLSDRKGLRGLKKQGQAISVERSQNSKIDRQGITLIEFWYHLT